MALAARSRQRTDAFEFESNGTWLAGRRCCRRHCCRQHSEPIDQLDNEKVHKSRAESRTRSNRFLSLAKDSSRTTTTARRSFAERVFESALLCALLSRQVILSLSLSLTGDGKVDHTAAPRTLCAGSLAGSQQRSLGAADPRKQRARVSSLRPSHTRASSARCSGGGSTPVRVLLCYVMFCSVLFRVRGRSRRALAAPATISWRAICCERSAGARWQQSPCGCAKRSSAQVLHSSI